MSLGNDKPPMVVEQILAPRELTTSSDSETKTRQLKLKCCEDIDIPEELPGILKKFTKGAITTQPRDLLHWSAAYFRSMCKGEVPPVKDRLEMEAKVGPNGLTKGLLRVLHKQLGGQARSDGGSLKSKWTDICLKAEDLQKLLVYHGLSVDGFSWTQFVALAADSIQPGDIREAMETICFVLADVVSHGVAITVPVEKFVEYYSFLAQKQGITQEIVEAVKNFLVAKGASQGNRIGPEDLKDPECPPLDGRR